MRARRQGGRPGPGAAVRSGAAAGGGRTGLAAIRCARALGGGARGRTGLAASLCALALGTGACGSAPVADLPPPAGPATSPPLTERPAGELLALAEARGQVPRPESPIRRATEDGRQIVTLDRRAREVVVRDAATGRRTGSAPAGTGPTHLVVGAADRAYVTDTVNDALLVFDLRPEPELIRRVYIPGAPYAMAADRESGELWIGTTETNELWRYKGGYRPVRLDIYPTVRQPDAIAVRDGRVFVTGRAERVVQVLEP